MTLSTLIHAGLVRPHEPTVALVLMGGGARTAYQAGVLSAIGRILAEVQPARPAPARLPFQLLVGTSAGALNASFLAARAQQDLSALSALAAFWHDLRSTDVYRLHLPSWARLSRITTAWQLARVVRERGALLDNLPLADTLHKAISLQGIDDGLQSKALDTLAVTASSYSSGEHWTFCHRAHDDRAKPWQRPGRRATFQQITMDHLMASSAIPLIFPAQALWVDSRVEFFGDGSMRQTSPLSPALHLGAHKILVIGVGQPQRSTLAGGAAASPEPGKLTSPGVGGVLGHALASVFHDTLHGDVEQALRMNDTLEQLPKEVAAVLPYRQVQVLSIQPSASLDALARTHAQALPQAVRTVLSALSGSAQVKAMPARRWPVICCLSLRSLSPCWPWASATPTRAKRKYAPFSAPKPAFASGTRNAMAYAVWRRPSGPTAPSMQHAAKQAHVRPGFWLDRPHQRQTSEGAHQRGPAEAQIHL